MVESDRRPSQNRVKHVSRESSEALQTGRLSDEERIEQARKVALHVAEAGLDKKAQQIEIIDVDGKVDYADFIVVMSGRSDRQVSAIAQGVAASVKKNCGVQCLGREGLNEGHWALIDFGDVIVHVFHEDTRGYYDIEGLWIDADRVPVEGQSATPQFDYQHLLDESE